jgi:hypothetical protein
MIEEQEDPDVQKALQEAVEDLELGRTLSLEELDRELGLTDEDLST